MDSFTWRGLEFERVQKDDPQIAHYQSGNWRVWGEIPRESAHMWWSARWESTRFQASLAPKGQAESYEKALEICLGRVREHSRRHAVSVQDLQRNLSLMTEERDALIHDLLELIPDIVER